MSDFGTEVGSSAMNAGSSVVTKLLSAIMSFFKHVYKIWENHPERKLTKEKLKTVEGENAKKAFIEKLEGKTGYIKFKDMEKAGINCTAIGITMTSEEMQDFSARCKREGIKFTATINRDDLDKDKKIYNILCPVADLQRMKSLVDRMNDDKLIAGIDKRIEEIESKGELSEQDKIDIEALKKQREGIKRDYCDMLNNEQAAGVCEKAVNGETKRGVTFDGALDRYTGGELDKSQFAIVCDAVDPTKYVKLHGYNDTFNGKTYIKTDYEVYNGSKMVYQTNDGRFEGRPKDYWYKEKVHMKEVGGFGDTVFKFYSMAEYERWAQNARTQNAVELAGFGYNGEEGRDYASFCDKLEAKLAENGFVYKDGVLVDKVTGEPCPNFIVDSMDASTKARIAESFAICNQIDNYKLLNEIEADLAVANSMVITTDEGTAEHTEALANYDDVKVRYQKALDTEKGLKEERMSINGVQAEQETRSNTPHNHEVVQSVGYYEVNNNVPVAERLTKGTELEKDVYSFELASGVEYEALEKKYKELNGEERDAEGRLERVDETEERQHTLTEYRDEIKNMRNDVGAKGNDVQEKATEIQKASTSKER
jgi:hypothetical protein